jgi:uncharacterized membrane protein
LIPATGPVAEWERNGDEMADKDEAPHDLYVAAYSDLAAAEAAWKSLKQLADDEVIEVEALALVERDSEGKIHVKDTSHEAGTGAKIGAVGGALVGLIFPPSLLASAALGAGLGAGAGAILDRVRKRKLKADVEWALAPGGSGVVVVFDEQWVPDVENALTGADKVVRDHLHDDDDESSIEERPSATEEPGPHPNFSMTPPSNT